MQPLYVFYYFVAVGDCTPVISGDNNTINDATDDIVDSNDQFIV